MSDNKVNYREENNIGWLTIDNPPVNALNNEVITQISEVVSELEKKKEFTVLIVTGEGEKAFVGGADIGEFPELDYDSGKELSQRGQKLFSKIEDLAFPVIAAVNGFALGGGCELALCCDIRLASSNAKFGQPEVGLGLIPGYGGTQRLPEVIGEGRAKELIFTGKHISANEAKEAGLVQNVFEDVEKLYDNCEQIAREILQNAPLAVKEAKKAVNESREKSLKKGLKREAHLFGRLCTTEDKNEGVEAFKEERKPDFKGK